MNMKLLFGLTIGFGVGFNVGLWLAFFISKRTYNDVINGYRKNTDEWFNEYLKMLKWYKEMKSMYFKEALKNITK